uniref:Nematode cuticle collagen N-terminal domain-containing protein n=1 Tax=Parascaris univalens TaxID=6257 RepID=A0A915C3V2_PARUN
INSFYYDVLHEMNEFKGMANDAWNSMMEVNRMRVSDFDVQPKDEDGVVREKRHNVQRSWYGKADGGQYVQRGRGGQPMRRNRGFDKKPTANTWQGVGVGVQQTVSQGVNANRAG